MVANDAKCLTEFLTTYETLIYDDGENYTEKTLLNSIFLRIAKLNSE